MTFKLNGPFSCKTVATIAFWISAWMITFCLFISSKKFLCRCSTSRSLLIKIVSLFIYGHRCFCAWSIVDRVCFVIYWTLWMCFRKEFEIQSSVSLSSDKGDLFAQILDYFQVYLQYTIISYKCILQNTSRIQHAFQVSPSTLTFVYRALNCTNRYIISSIVRSKNVT